MREALPIRGIAFDFDGTLTDSAHGLTAALNQMLSEHGRPGAYRHLDRQRHRCAGEERAALDYPDETGRYAAEAVRLRFDESHAGMVAAGSTR
ncbi:MAG: Phosphoglycolate phosphatase [Sodalis sp.]|nr:MAG: Phosphoglycolate phosphatase [Sodalis sp.]